MANTRDHAPSAIGKPFVRQSRGDTRVTLEDKHQAVAQRAAEIAERRAAQQQLRRQGSTLAPLHTQTRAERWNSSGPGSCIGVE